MALELSDNVLAAVVPIVVYWVVAGIYEFLGYFFENYRLHPKGEEYVKNIASRWDVLKGVLLQQAIQVAVALSLLKLTGDDGGVPKPQPSFLVIALQFFIAMVVLDSWQYFGHRYMHANKFLYKHIHSDHHVLIVPYAFGALYNNPLEGLFLDTIGGSLAFLLSGMTPRTSFYFFSFATIKSVDAHCGLWLPCNPLQIFSNNAAYHDLHHQLKGLKYNFSQPFFVAWDKILGTYLPFEVEKRKEGGYEVRLITKD